MLYTGMSFMNYNVDYKMCVCVCVFGFFLQGTLLTKSMLQTICVILVCTKECPKVRDYPIIEYPIHFYQVCPITQVYIHPNLQ